MLLKRVPPYERVHVVVSLYTFVVSEGCIKGMTSLVVLLFLTNFPPAEKLLMQMCLFYATLH